MPPSSIAGINRLPAPEKREVYQRIIAPEVLERFQLSPFLVDKDGNDLLEVEAPSGGGSVELSLYHQYGFRDPITYGHLTDNVNGRIHVLLYIMNDPESPRFEVDRMPDGTPTRFGTERRNLKAEADALEYGLVPGQVRSGLNLLAEAVRQFEQFIKSLEQEMYFVEPLYYHNAVIFERYGFAYQSGRRLMQHIQAGFSPGGELLPRLDGSTFRRPEAANSIRLRSWAIHDGVLGEPFTNVTMYKAVGKKAKAQITPDVPW